MGEKKKDFHGTELNEQDLEKVAGGEDYHYDGPQITCIICGVPFTPSNYTEEIYKKCSGCKHNNPEPAKRRYD